MGGSLKSFVGLAVLHFLANISTYTSFNKGTPALLLFCVALQDCLQDYLSMYFSTPAGWQTTLSHMGLCRRLLLTFPVSQERSASTPVALYCKVSLSKLRRENSSSSINKDNAGRRQVIVFYTRKHSKGIKERKHMLLSCFHYMQP